MEHAHILMQSEQIWIEPLEYMPTDVVLFQSHLKQTDERIYEHFACILVSEFKSWRWCYTDPVCQPLFTLVYDNCLKLCILCHFVYLVLQMLSDSKLR